MVSPTLLRAICALGDGDRDAFEPGIDASGTVAYPAVERHLEAGEDDYQTDLTWLAERGVLAEEFVAKVYVCPDCDEEGMQYSTGCPRCRSIHVTSVQSVRHGHCGEVLESSLEQSLKRPEDRTAAPDRERTVSAVPEDGDPADESTQGNDSAATTDSTGPSTGSDESTAGPGVGISLGESCDHCGETISEDNVERVKRYGCHDCSGTFDSTVHCLWCRACEAVYPPEETREVVCHRYRLTPKGDRWCANQMRARDSIVAALESRGYDTDPEATVVTDDGQPIPVHVHAEDDLFDDRLVIDVHEQVLPSNLQRLQEAAATVDARAIVCLTGGRVSDPLATTVASGEVTLVRAADGALERVGDVQAPESTSGSVLDWVGAVVEAATARR